MTIISKKILLNLLLCYIRIKRCEAGMGNNVMDNWNASMYDGSHQFVSKYGESLVDLLDPQKSETILDVGCGTGDLANSLAKLGCNVIGIDKSANMVQLARVKYSKIPFHVKDVLEIDYKDEFDAVFSNATLHWIKQPKDALQAIFHSLKVGGRFVAEFGGEGNVKMITEEIRKQFARVGIEYKSPWYYPSIGQYTSLMEEVGFRVTFAAHFDRPTRLEGEHGLRNWIEMFGTSFFESVPAQTKNEIMTRVVDNLKTFLYKDDQWTADYKRLRVIGYKLN
jgi:ubiquinone/menaquinone biosynthesis C-methylase UbiE